MFLGTFLFLITESCHYEKATLFICYAVWTKIGSKENVTGWSEYFQLIMLR